MDFENSAPTKALKLKLLELHTLLNHSFLASIKFRELLEKISFPYSFHMYEYVLAYVPGTVTVQHEELRFALQIKMID